MKDEKDVTIKAHDLDWLLQLAVVGSRIHQRKEDQKVLLEDVDRLRALNAPKPRNNRRLSDSPGDRGRSLISPSRS
jgi:hypothetical protein